MQTFNIEGSTGRSTILIGETIKNADRYLPPGTSPVVITDENVSGFYKTYFPSKTVIEIGTGESVKTLDTVRSIYRQLLEFEVDRSAFILGIGGGIVCDVAGFVASTYLRGIRFGFVSTTLLSQVDASVGGKNGVNLDGYKNIIGVFNQPEFVICDTDLLKTLPEKEILSGFGEIVKHAVLGDRALFEFLEDRFPQALKLDGEVIQRLVHDSIVLKSAIVNQDEREGGVRRKLNLGHTFGHAIEKITGATHGEAVSAGIIIAAKLSVKKGRLASQQLQRIESLLQHLNLPTHIPADRSLIFDALKRDKKRKGDNIHFVLPTDIGDCEIESISIDALEAETRHVWGT